MLNLSHQNKQILLGLPVNLFVESKQNLRKMSNCIFYDVKETVKKRLINSYGKNIQIHFPQLRYGTPAIINDTQKIQKYKEEQLEWSILALSPKDIIIMLMMKIMIMIIKKNINDK